jgi:hypothetical protein
MIQSMPIKGMPVTVTSRPAPVEAAGGGSCWREAGALHLGAAPHRETLLTHR